jgi:heme/copper-type cytochrome/quinol oxidase subunit 3
MTIFIASWAMLFASLFFAYALTGCGHRSGRRSISRRSRWVCPPPPPSSCCWRLWR